MTLVNSGHPDAEDLAAFADGRQDAPATSGLETHLRACLPCFHIYREVLTGLLEAQVHPGSPPGSLEAVGSPEPPRREPTPRPRRWGRPALVGTALTAAGAAVILALGVARERAWERDMGPVLAAVSTASADGWAYPHADPNVEPGPRVRSSGGTLPPGFEPALDRLQARFERDADRRTAYWLGAGLTVAGRHQLARTYLDATRGKFPEDPDLQVLDAIVAAGEGETARAESLWTGVLERHPDHQAARRNLDRLRQELASP